MMGLFGSKTFKPSTDIPDQSGKVFLVTGGNTGLGYEAIKQIASHSPQHIYLASRTPSKGQAAVAELQKAYPSVNITFLPLDLASFESVAAAAREFSAKESRLDCLLNNAGIMATPPGKTEEGYEIQFGTNHMGHALLTRLLMPTLQATTKLPGADVRIVNLTSEGHNFARTAPVLLDQAQLERSNAWTKYGYSKLANILFARELAVKYPNITSVAVHPGVIKTDLYIPNRKSNFIMRAGMAIGGSFMGTIETGALNSLWAATGKKGDIQSGAYYTPIGTKSQGSPCARNADLAAKLWEWTEKELVAKGY